MQPLQGSNVISQIVWGGEGVVSGWSVGPPPSCARLPYPPPPSHVVAGSAPVGAWGCDEAGPGSPTTTEESEGKTDIKKNVETRGILRNLKERVEILCRAASFERTLYSISK